MVIILNRRSAPESLFPQDTRCHDIWVISVRHNSVRCGQETVLGVSEPVDLVQSHKNDLDIIGVHVLDNLAGLARPWRVPVDSFSETETKSRVRVFLVVSEVSDFMLINWFTVDKTNLNAAVVDGSKEVDATDVFGEQDKTVIEFCSWVHQSVLGAVLHSHHRFFVRHVDVTHVFASFPLRFPWSIGRTVGIRVKVASELSGSVNASLKALAIVEF